MTKYKLSSVMIVLQWNIIRAKFLWQVMHSWGFKSRYMFSSPKHIKEKNNYFVTQHILSI